MSTPKIVIGSRGSQLALWQANHIQARLREMGAETRIEIIKTTGDKITDVPLAQVGGKGLFTKEIEEALLNGSIDLAVHSLKDMPTALPDGLILSGIPEREDPRDAWIGKPLDQMKPGARIGTSSLRRAAQLHSLNRGFVIESLRGNVDTRLRKLDEGLYDAIILAAAGLRRLGWADRINVLMDPELMCPAVGQGALAIETRNDEGWGRAFAGKLDHTPTRLAVTAERALLATLEGGCQVPIGAHAIVDHMGLDLRAVVASPDGKSMIRDRMSGPDPVTLGKALGARLLASGAREILNAVPAN
ncbi:MAG: hydroxymethylbilane synthase [Bryobacteraceae bacterium]